VPTFYYWKELFDFFINYFNSHGGHLMFSAPMSGFVVSLKVSALAGTLIASPFIFTQLWLFVAPGLYAREKKVVVPFVFFSTVCFGSGAYFAHQIGFPAMWRFFAGFEDPGRLDFLPTLDYAFGMYVKIILGLGLVFQMPMLVFFLARFGVVTAGFMLRKIKYATLIIVVTAALITPSGDWITLMVFAGPMMGLYVVSIGVAWLFGKKRPRQAEELT
jgi:sec-independent protein translocase protein TatC